MYICQNYRKNKSVTIFETWCVLQAMQVATVGRLRGRGECLAGFSSFPPVVGGWVGCVDDVPALMVSNFVRRVSMSQILLDVSVNDEIARR